MWQQSSGQLATTELLPLLCANMLPSQEAVVMLLEKRSGEDTPQEEENKPVITNRWHLLTISTKTWPEKGFIIVFWPIETGPTNLLYITYLFCVQFFFGVSGYFCNMQPCLPFWNLIIVLPGARGENILVVYRGWIPVWTWASSDQYIDCTESMTTSKAPILPFPLWAN